jgi:hypothetical protein
MPDSKITIRLPETLAAKLAEVADAHKVTRTAVLLDLLATGIETWEPAQQRTVPSNITRLDGAIEALRLELSEAIERIERIERRANAQPRPAVSAQPRPAESDDKNAQPEPTPPGATYTAQELAVHLKLNVTAKNRSRAFRSRGYEIAGGTKGLWRLKG